MDTLADNQEDVSLEIQALQSIYEGAIRVLVSPTTAEDGNIPTTSSSRSIRYELTLNLLHPHDDMTARILVSLPSTYPDSAPPQLQLLSRYIGPYGTDSTLFGAILRTYISATGVIWSSGSVCVFDGLQHVLERCTSWYEERSTSRKVGVLLREDERGGPDRATASLNVGHDKSEPPPPAYAVEQRKTYPVGVQLYTAEPIVDRKSSFVGRACRISHPSEVPQILSYLIRDRRISRAAHPIINAWRCNVENSIHHDNDDDGETAAGSRLAHLLQISDVNNVLVIVSRYFGGVHLGPDRFKHINQAARNALEIGGFLDKPASRGKKH